MREYGRELSILLGGEFTEDEIGIAEFGAESWVVSTEAEARKLVGTEVENNRFQPVITASSAGLTVAKMAEAEVEIITDNEDILG